MVIQREAIDLSGQETSQFINHLIGNLLKLSFYRSNNPGVIIDSMGKAAGESRTFNTKLKWRNGWFTSVLGGAHLLIKLIESKGFFSQSGEFAALSERYKALKDKYQKTISVSNKNGNSDAGAANKAAIDTGLAGQAKIRLEQLFEVQIFIDTLLNFVVNNIGSGSAEIVLSGASLGYHNSVHNLYQFLETSLFDSSAYNETDLRESLGVAQRNIQKLASISENGMLILDDETLQLEISEVVNLDLENTPKPLLHKYLLFFRKVAVKVLGYYGKIPIEYYIEPSELEMLKTARPHMWRMVDIFDKLPKSYFFDNFGVGSVEDNSRAMTWLKDLSLILDRFESGLQMTRKKLGIDPSNRSELIAHAVLVINSDKSSEVQKLTSELNTYFIEQIQESYLRISSLLDSSLLPLRGLRNYFSAKFHEWNQRCRKNRIDEIIGVVSELQTVVSFLLTD